jgi:tetratricopeptide (TPR) repeat protein
MRFLQKTADRYRQIRANQFAINASIDLDRNRNERAWRRCSAALQLKPNLTDAYVTRGRARYRLDDYNGAIADYTTALTNNPRAELYLNRALAYYAQGEIIEALGDLNMAIYLNPKQAYAYSARGLIEESRGNHSGAIADYTYALRINPRIDTVYTDRASARANRGDLSGAIADFQRYLALGGGVRHGDQSRVETMIATLQTRLEQQASR